LPPFPRRSTFAAVSLRYHALLPADELLRQPRVPPKPPCRCATTSWNSLTTLPSPPAITIAGIGRSTLPLPSDPGQGPDCKDCNLSWDLFCKKTFSFYSFSSEFCKILEKCKKIK
jgi:hypothetical protein